MCLIWIELCLFIIDLEDRTHTHALEHTQQSQQCESVCCEKNKTNSNQEEVNSRTPSQRKWEAAGFSNQETLGEQEVVRRRRRRGKEKDGGGRGGEGRGGGGGRGFINSPPSMWVNVPASSAAAHVRSLSNLAESRTAPPGTPTERRPPSGASGAARSSRHSPPLRGVAVAY